MLTLRFLRSGRRNRAFFRIVLTEKSKPAKSGFNKILGWYDPKTKESSFDREKILKLVGNGAIPSNSLAKLLIEKKVTHKNIKFTPDTPKKARSKEKPEEKKPEAKAEDVKTEEAEEKPEPATGPVEENEENKEIKSEETKK